MTRFIATVAVWMAMVATMAFNAHFGWQMGSTDFEHRFGAFVSLCIDLGKCSFLMVAAHQWSKRAYAKAMLLAFVFFPLCLGYSVNAGLGFFATSRESATAEKQTQSDNRRRAQASYDTATATLESLRDDPSWSATAACSKPTSKAGRDFCARVKGTEEEQRGASAKLTDIPAGEPDPQARLWSDILGLPFHKVKFALAMLTPVIAEIMAGFGLYLLSTDNAPKPPSKLVEKVLSWVCRLPAWKRNKSSTVAPVAVTKGPAVVAKPSPRPQLTFPK